jgi:spore coat protein U-like protein
MSFFQTPAQTPGSAARAAASGCLLVAAALGPWAAHADCRFTSADGVSFGAYDVFSRLPNNAGVGSLQVHCQGVGHGAVVKLSTGLSRSYSQRTMRSGNDVLAYNLYTTPARVDVWGDGSGGSSVVPAPKNKNTSLDIFGSIPAGQDPAVGSYADIIFISVDFGVG